MKKSWTHPQHKRDKPSNGRLTSRSQNQKDIEKTEKKNLWQELKRWKLADDMVL